MILSSTRLYEFCDLLQRGEWLDIFVALMEYLRSGTSRFGFLNNAVSNNMLHKAAGVALNQHEEGFGESGNGGTGYCDDLLMVWKTSLPTRRSARLKRTLQDEESANVKRQKP